jgi:general secretion pathway protein K
VNRRSRQRRGGREGFILISVLGALIVLAGLVAAASYLVRTAATGAAALREELAADALLRSGVELAAYQLFMLKRPAGDLSGQRIRLNDGVITLAAVAEQGKIDLNGAPPEALASLWKAAGAPRLDPRAFAARVVDYRDEDGERTRNGGAEAADYAAAGKKGPANAPFEQIDELQNVLGVEPDDVRALAPLVTVHNPSGKIAAFDAAPGVIEALPEGAMLAGRIAALRSRQLEDPEGAVASLGQAGGLVSLDRAQSAFTVRIEAVRGRFVRTADVVLTAARVPEALYFVTEWTDGPSR